MYILDDEVIFFILIVNAGLVSGLIFMTTAIIIEKDFEFEKLSAYECGFDAYEDTRKPFDVQFYIFAMLFLIYDIEVAFLFPWVLVLGITGWLGYITGLIFIFMLGLSLAYEWASGCLDWEQYETYEITVPIE